MVTPKKRYVEFLQKSFSFARAFLAYALARFSTSYESAAQGRQTLS